MKLFLLEARSKRQEWQPWYDKAFAFVVRAGDEKAARVLASKKAGDEGAAAWLNVEASTCVELDKEGLAEVIIRDYASA